MRGYLYQISLAVGLLTCSVIFFIYKDNNSEPVTEYSKITGSNKLIEKKYPVKKHAGSQQDNLKDLASTISKDELEIKDAADNYISRKIQDALSGNTTPIDSGPLEEIKVLFPTMAKKIEHYQANVKIQNTNLADYKSLVAQRNQMLRNNTYIPEYLQFELAQKKNDLLNAANILGREAILINAEIRRQAALYQTQVN
ncbi:hypothetical protein [uncultured Microbulbifer sp.]|uniref:hypothetical protein n=1 Tax=uncultured Microbulbifer sp. TaxID=348147 RepID=UPI00261EDF8B|nr:hypothetical protein [uncultured Microbulbifer sp.]